MCRNIETQSLFGILDRQEISYAVKGDPKPSYRLASLFNPVSRGFYFLVEGIGSFPAEDSLILTSTQQVDCSSTNTLVILDADPQATYYRVLGWLFGQVSTGEICESSRISENAKIGNNVQIDSFCVINNDCVIGDGTIIGSHTVVHENTTIGTEVIIGEHSSIGASGMAWTWGEDEEEKIVQPQLGGVLIEDKCRLGAHSVLVRGSLNEKTFVGEGTLIAPGVRLGHGTQIGAYTHLANDVTTGGNTKIGEYCFVGSSAVFRPKVRVADNTIVGAGAVVVKDTTDKGLTLMGVPAKEYSTKENPSGMPKPRTPNQ